MQTVSAPVMRPHETFIVETPGYVMFMVVACTCAGLASDYSRCTATRLLSTACGNDDTLITTAPQGLLQT